MNTCVNDPGDSWVDEAIAVANIPTLTCVLVHITGDTKWIEGKYVPTRTIGFDDNDSGGLPDDIQAEIRNAACHFIKKWLNDKVLEIDSPDDALLLQMMSVSLGDKVPPEYAPLLRQELKYTQSIHDVAGNHQAKQALKDSLLADTFEDVEIPADFSVLIIGSGLSGICAAINLSLAGIPYTIVEKTDKVGGVWRDNKYPGVACDVPSHLYSYSFANYDWTRYFADSNEIEKYINYVADIFDIRRNIQFGVEITEAIYQEDSKSWLARAIDAEGNDCELQANVLVSAVGVFNKPKIPGNIQGLGNFKGQSAHTALWPEGGVDLDNKKVIVIGNGASSMQLVPAIADQVSEMVVIQRSPQWAVPFPKFLKKVPPVLHRLMNEVPLYRLWYRLRLSWAFNDKLYESLQIDPSWPDQSRSINRQNDSHRKFLTDYIVSEIGEHKELLPKVLPDYPPYGKRILLDNGWFKTLTRPNVELLCGGVREVREHSVILDDGSEVTGDVIIWATGFDVANFLVPMKLIGKGGRVLHDDWDGDDARAYLGATVPGYPNFFCLYGPNTQFGHGGNLIGIIERQTHYLMSLISQILKQDIEAFEVKEDVYEDYSRQIDDKHEHMIWKHPGMSTYYRNSKGRVVVCNPFKIIEWWDMTESADLADFSTVKRNVPVV